MLRSFLQFFLRGSPNKENVSHTVRRWLSIGHLVTPNVSIQMLVTGSLLTYTSFCFYTKRDAVTKTLWMVLHSYETS